MVAIATTEVGRFRVHAVEAGFVLRDPSSMLPDSDPGVWTPEQPGYADGAIRLTFGCFVVAGPDGVVLVDTGLGGPTAGGLSEALEVLGVDRGDVADVVHTHLHPDHTGGDVVDGEPAFPSARFHVHERELAWWFDESEPDRERGRAPFRAVVASGRHRTVVDGAEIAGHLRIVETFGHTPGHVSIELESGGDRLFIGGDVTHHPVQAAHPEWNNSADVDPTAARETRQRVFAMLADQPVTMANGHYPRPGIGHIVTEGTAYKFVY
jgi:glyoxylase-like metal-dependent hydrolase (beta-lactamase superfamily II)